MSLRYCLACKKICDDFNALVNNESYQCPTCKKPLIYFGREQASISIESILTEYDALHPYNPVKDFQGVAKDYSNPQTNIGLIECEEILKHDPNNQEALRHLSKHFWAQGLIQKSLDYMNKLNQINSVISDDIIYYVSLLLIQKEYQSITNLVIKYQELITPFLLHHYLAVSYLGLNQFQDALTQFYQAYHSCDDEDRKKKIKKMIRYLNSILDKSSP